MQCASSCAMRNCAACDAMQCNLCSCAMRMSSLPYGYVQKKCPIITKNGPIKKGAEKGPIIAEFCINIFLACPMTKNMSYQSIMQK